MARQAAAQPDDVPNLPGLVMAMANGWRAVIEAQGEMDPHGAAHEVLAEVRRAVEAAADRLTGQSGFLALTMPPGASYVLTDRDGRVLQ